MEALSHRHCSGNSRERLTGRKAPEDDKLVFINVHREFMREMWPQVGEHMFGFFFKIDVMVWLSKTGKYSSQKII